MRVIFDTNIWISYLFNSNFHWLDEEIASGNIKLIFSDELFNEFIEVVNRPKIEKFIIPENFIKLITILDEVATFIKVTSRESICRDAKDNFLLDLARDSKADFLISGDTDLLELKNFSNCKILKIEDFKTQFFT